MTKHSQYSTPRATGERSNRSVGRLADLFEESLAAVPEFEWDVRLLLVGQAATQTIPGVLRTCSTWLPGPR